MGRHYPDLHADPVKQHGYYYSKRAHRLARLKVGDKLPRHMGPWEFVARDDEGTSSEMLQRLRRMHPDVDPYRLTFSTSTPVDLAHLARLRAGRRAATLVASLLALGLGIAIGRRLLRRR